MVREDALETMTVTQSQRSLRKVTPKSRCSRTVKDEMSRRVCQTWGQLETNARNGVANTARARQGTTMNHTPMLEESREGLRDSQRRQWQLGDAAAMLEVNEEDPSG
uniref:Uncharacterized protein n=1 Tax=Oryza barthii TaxID=65489 RepID=A0A0D3GU61_9ORYZ